MSEKKAVINKRHIPAINKKIKKTRKAVVDSFNEFSFLQKDISFQRLFGKCSSSESENYSDGSEKDESDEDVEYEKDYNSQMNHFMTKEPQDSYFQASEHGDDLEDEFGSSESIITESSENYSDSEARGKENSVNDEFANKNKKVHSHGHYKRDNLGAIIMKDKNGKRVPQIERHDCKENDYKIRNTFYKIFRLLETYKEIFACQYFLNQKVIPQLNIDDEGRMNKMDHEISQFSHRRFVDDDDYLDESPERNVCFYFNEVGFCKRGKECSYLHV